MLARLANRARSEDDAVSVVDIKANTPNLQIAKVAR